MVATLDAQGHDDAFQEVPAEVFSTFFPGAEEMAQMLAYWQEFTTGRITDFATWASENMPVT
jgi:hypothetical protein